MRTKQLRNEISQKRSIAGQRGSEIKWARHNDEMTNAKQLLYNKMANDDKGKERKGKETKDITTPCPYQGIVDLYHSLLPGLPRVKELTAARKGYLKARWMENSDRQSLSWWESFFKTYVLPSDFLQGRVPGRDGGKPFKADLEWLTRPNNFVKVHEGRYLPEKPLQAQKRPVTTLSNTYKPTEWKPEYDFDTREVK